MSEPTVCCIMLTRDRPELAKKAVECFRKQTYAFAQLFIFDTGNEKAGYFLDDDKVSHCWTDLSLQSWTVGKLRNEANEIAKGFDIFCHWDDDDWSHPNRIAEQVHLLQSSGAEVVGYSDMLFSRTTGSLIEEDFLTGEKHVTEMAEAWLYAHQTPKRPYALGTSLCYWRRAWEAVKFNDETQGVEDHWLNYWRDQGKLTAITSQFRWQGPSGNGHDDLQPRMIARIHGGNTSNGYNLEDHLAKGSKEWKRLPGWNRNVREILG